MLYFTCPTWANVSTRRKNIKKQDSMKTQYGCC